MSLIRGKIRPPKRLIFAIIFLIDNILQKCSIFLIDSKVFNKQSINLNNILKTNNLKHQFCGHDIQLTCKGNVMNMNDFWGDFCSVVFVKVQWAHNMCFQKHIILQLEKRSSGDKVHKDNHMILFFFYVHTLSLRISIISFFIIYTNFILFI